MTGTPLLSVVAGVTRAKLRTVTCTTSCAHRSPSPQLALCSNPRDAPSPPPAVRVRARFPASATAAALRWRRRRRRRTATTAEVSVNVFSCARERRRRRTAAMVSAAPTPHLGLSRVRPPQMSATFLSRRFFTSYKTRRDVMRGPLRCYDRDRDHDCDRDRPACYSGRAVESSSSDGPSWRRREMQRDWRGSGSCGVAAAVGGGVLWSVMLSRCGFISPKRLVIKK